MREHVVATFHSRSHCIKFCKKVMYGQAYKKIYIIGVSHARGARHMGKES